MRTIGEQLSFAVLGTTLCLDFREVCNTASPRLVFVKMEVRRNEEGQENGTKVGHTGSKRCTIPVKIN